MFFILSKRLFSFSNVQFFVFSSSTLFSPVRHCFRGWSKKNLKIYDVINCLIKNFVTHFVWYLEKEIRCDTETLSIDRESNKEHFYQNPFLILLNNQKQPLHARNYFENNVFWKRVIKKPLKRQLYFFIWTQSILMDKVIKNKRGLELFTSCSSSYRTSS